MKAAIKNRDFRNRLPLYLTIIAVVILSINPGWTQGDKCINLLLCAFIAISPLALLLKECRILVPKIDIPLILVCVFVIAFPLIFHPDTIRWNTMLFTCAYCVFFMMFTRLAISSGIQPADFYKTAKGIVYAYFIVLIIQQICVTFGLPVFLRGYMHYSNPYKLGALSAEPSHTTVLLSTLIYFYGQIKRYQNSSLTLWKEFRQNPWLWIAYYYVILTTVNASALLLGIGCLLPFVTKKNVIYALVTGVVCSLILFLIPWSPTSQPDRLKQTLISVVTLDEEAIMAGDLSSSERIVPSIRGAKLIQPARAETYIGHGVDADKTDTEPQPYHWFENGTGFAGIFSMWHNYGALAAISFWTAIFLVTVIKKSPLTWLTFILALQLSADYNMQFIWQLMAVSLIYKFAIRKGV